jgi:hypothetical protein
MEKHEIKEFFEENERKINERFVELMMEVIPNYEGFGDKSEHNYRAGSGFLTPVLQTALMTDSPALMDFQASWSKDRMPHYGLEIPQLKNNLILYKQVIDEAFPDELQAKANSIIDHLVEQLSE